MADPISDSSLPAPIAAILNRFSALDRESKMAALLSYARKLEPIPESLAEQARMEEYAVPECQTPVRIIPVSNGDRIHFYAAIDARQSPTVAAFLSLLFSCLNDQPAVVTRSIPNSFVRDAMRGLGLGTREVGLEAIVARLKRYASA